MAYTTPGEDERTIEQLDVDLIAAAEEREEPLAASKHVDEGACTDAVDFAEDGAVEIGRFLDDVFDAGMDRENGGAPDKQGPVV